jgi:hypothetical protein
VAEEARCKAEANLEEEQRDHCDHRERNEPAQEQVHGLGVHYGKICVAMAVSMVVRVSMRVRVIMIVSIYRRGGRRSRGNEESRLKAHLCGSRDPMEIDFVPQALIPL